MKKRYYILIAFLAALIVVGGAAAYMYFKPHKDFGSSRADYILDAKGLIQEFEADEAQANKKFVTGDKTILVSGTINEVSKSPEGNFSVVLTEGEMPGSISCSLMPQEIPRAEKLKKGGKLQVKGQCTGMQELIDKQIIMIRCVIVQQ